MAFQILWDFVDSVKSRPGQTEGTRDMVGGGDGSGWDTSSHQEQIYLDGGPSESGQLFNVRSFLPDDGTHGLGGDEEVHDLLLWILEGQDRKHLHRTAPGTQQLQSIPRRSYCPRKWPGVLQGEAGGMNLTRGHTNYTTKCKLLLSTSEFAGYVCSWAFCQVQM